MVIRAKKINLSLSRKILISQKKKKKTLPLSYSKLLKIRKYRGNVFDIFTLDLLKRLNSGYFAFSRMGFAIII